MTNLKLKMQSWGLTLHQRTQFALDKALVCTQSVATTHFKGRSVVSVRENLLVSGGGNPWRHLGFNPKTITRLHIRIFSIWRQGGKPRAVLQPLLLACLLMRQLRARRELRAACATRQSSTASQRQAVSVKAAAWLIGACRGLLKLLHR